MLSGNIQQRFGNSYHSSTQNRAFIPTMLEPGAYERWQNSLGREASESRNSVTPDTNSTEENTEFTTPPTSPTLWDRGVPSRTFLTPPSTPTVGDESPIPPPRSNSEALPRPGSFSPLERPDSQQLSSPLGVPTPSPTCRCTSPTTPISTKPKSCSRLALVEGLYHGSEEDSQLPESYSTPVKPKPRRPVPTLEHVGDLIRAGSCCAVLGGVDEYIPSLFNIIPRVQYPKVEADCIKTSTLASLLRGDFRAFVDQVLVFDCRYDYEYRDGHVVAAINLPPESDARVLLHRLLFGGLELEAIASRTLIIFHCEFSQKRGPAMYRYFNQMDRSNYNGHHNFSRVGKTYQAFLMAKGYSSFHAKFPDLCGGYTKMKDRPEGAPAPKRTKSFSRTSTSKS
ncbi:cell division cycle 25d [Pelomyxa schiedti]|nr:cell division cycle 25d [Pelomyxa schiedti]